ncbi:2'-5' RNA ligase family protein [Novosphingobium cyanobacteriorum]|uniref:2'-5' RNA ligase family protein n=1 Tax=Novosphingobium cyanobacteriorum TaxID=3024215 RepID=A0ABT6CLJ7_9SPHN|nr:2'-5' RNA ligase family protein [Novosphingobium cyanobacteriorum]MDF8334791.1 2'-5' RNA ligase family protein [Novosphingobium cyanobacteriorum]
MAQAPLIVTADLPPALQSRMDALRRAHFPPERNFLSAHVTLFHALPPFVEDEARGLLAQLAGAVAAPAARLSGVMNLGGGTAFRIDCPALLDLRAGIAEHFHGMLTNQDSHPPRLHVTVQNKVTKDEARALQVKLEADFRPEDFRFAALSLHRYLGGPWEAVGRWPFRG